MRSLLLVIALAAGCQPPMFVARGSFVSDAPTPVIRADVHIELSFFGIPLAGAQDVVFVLDRSGSMDGLAAGFAGKDVGMSETQSALVGIGSSLVNMGTHALPSKMAAAKAELVRTLQAMPDGTRFTIIFFDDKINAFSPTLVTLDDGTRNAAIEFVRRINSGGSTAAVPALRLAYAAGAARVVLLSDGLANTGGDGDDLLREARGAMARGVRIDTVGLGIDQDAELMTRLAAESGGLTVRR